MTKRRFALLYRVLWYILWFLLYPSSWRRRDPEYREYWFSITRWVLITIFFVILACENLFGFPMIRKRYSFGVGKRLNYPSSLSAVASTHPWSPDRYGWYRNPLDQHSVRGFLFLGQGRIPAVTLMPCMLPLRVRVSYDEWGDWGSRDLYSRWASGGLWGRES